MSSVGQHFFFVVDDGGIPSTPVPLRIGEELEPIPYEVYLEIVQIAEKNGIRIPVAFVLKHLDVDNISGVAEPLPYAQKLINLLIENQSQIEFAYHGLTHSYAGTSQEFFLVSKNEKVPASEQEKHLRLSLKIVKALGLPKPEVFVPPFNSWEEGVTDRLAAEYGLTQLVSVKKMKIGDFNYSWNTSTHLEFLPRKPMGLYHWHMDIDQGCYMKMPILGVKLAKIDVGWVKKSLITGRPSSILARQVDPSKVHSYMVHIGNFRNSTQFWNQLFKWIREASGMKICRNSVEAGEAWRKLSSKA